ncbi:glycosyltransferase family 2 protein [Flavisolibacter nicotianae]|uniref:glycosyltransferase family 2 protein n=1 Tax=Flavisolibacter nicotianae TaxID=2364882 RepID=UPI000EB386BC|nr:glycosyltransferase family 2 protein [Flavisolibacter nicotianae]
MPEVSVILPVYNGETYLNEAIDSILAQSFTDFELLLINDGSTDSSEQIILSYSDPRIRYLKNEKNKGLIYSLNYAVSEAKGKYIARMDADDIALPQRLEKQVQHLRQKNVAVLATRVNLIDASGNPLPDWQADKSNITFKEIKKYLPLNNCLAHPTVMANADIFKRYPYRENQKYSEDYDVWLRLLAKGLQIEKLPEPLLLHRILPTSATRFKKINLFLRLAKVKFRFLAAQVKQRHFGKFESVVFVHACLDLLKAAGKQLKSHFSK